MARPLAHVEQKIWDDPKEPAHPRDAQPAIYAQYVDIEGAQGDLVIVDVPTAQLLAEALLRAVRAASA